MTPCKDQDLMEIIFGHYKLGKYKLMIKGIHLYDKDDFFNEIFGFIKSKFKGYSNDYCLHDLNNIYYWYGKYKDVKG